MTLGFIPARNRDASAAIRGYVYQVHLTIQRWIDLEPDSVLEIERGEDIDRVSQALTSESNEQQRLLEQVKDYQGSLTLHSPAVIGAIANFVEHLCTNPQLNLRFLFTTTARVGREQQSLLSNGMDGGITVWEQIRTGFLQPPLKGSMAESLRAMLRSRAKPKDLPDKTWGLFQDFLSSASISEWLDFVCHVEWSTHQPSLTKLEQGIRTRLLESQFASDEQQATEQYQRLFLHVFKLLAQSGIKQLTVEARNFHLSLPTLNVSDHALLMNVLEMVRGVEERLSVVEEGLSMIQAQMEQVFKDDSALIVVNYLPHLHLDVPQPIRLMSYRTDTIHRLLQDMLSCTWMALDGSAGQGKTHLAILLVQKHGNPLWLRLRGLSSEQVMQHIHAVYEKLLAQTNHQVILVLDDLPRLNARDRLTEVMALLTRAAADLGIHILSTSNHRLPSVLDEMLTSQQLRSVPCPGLTDEEVEDILRLHDAPVVPKLAKFINITANQHPTLVNAAVRYLRQHNWQTNTETFEGLIRDGYAAAIQSETMDRLLKETENEESRELLYRLNIFTHYFSASDVIAIAEVTPPVSHPLERLADLTGRWVQYEYDDQFSISALIKLLRVGTLDKSTAQACHLTIAERVIHKGTLNQYEVAGLISHLVAAKAYDRAALLLIRALGELILVSSASDATILLASWYDLPLPPDMNLGLRICLRGLQIAARHHFGKPIIPLVKDLKELSSQVSDNELWAVFAAAMHACSALSERYIKLANSLLLNALRLIPDGKVPDNSLIVFPSEIMLEVLIWEHARGITTPDQLRNWLNTLMQFTPRQIHRAFSGESATDGCLLAANRLWLIEAKKPAEKRQWKPILDVIGELERQAWQRRLKFLWACAIRAKMVILAEYMQDFDAMLGVATAALRRAPNDPRVHFLIRECRGRQYLYTNRDREALVLLDEALGYHTTDLLLIRLHTLLSAGIAAGELEAVSAISYLQQAVRVAKASADIPGTELVKTLGELAVAEWLVGNLVGAFDAVDQATEALLANRADTDAWKDQFIVLALVVSRLSEIVYTGAGTRQTVSSESYLPISRGIFLQSTHVDRATLYDPRNDCILFDSLIHFAEATGQYKRMAVWTSRGIDAARSLNRLTVLSDILRSAIPALILASQYGEALKSGLEAGVIEVLQPDPDQKVAGKGLIDIDMDIQAKLVEGLSDNDRVQAEQLAAIWVLLPITFHLHRRILTQPNEAQLAVAELIQVCHQVKETAIAQQLWSVAASVLEQTFLAEMSGNHLVEWGNKAEKIPSNFIQILCYLGATVKDDTSIKSAAQIHLIIMPTVCRLIKPSSATYRRIVLPYLVDYWSTQLHQAPNLFGSPHLLGQTLAEALQMPERIQAQRILNGVALSLDIKPETDAIQWLSTDNGVSFT